MALATFSDLKSSVSTWLARSDMAGMAEDFITLAEARLNRELNPVETEATLTGVASSRSIDVSAQAVEEPIALFIADSATGNEREVLKKGPGEFAFITDEGAPTLWAFDNNRIVFDRPVDQAYSFRFRFTQRFKLSNDNPTNWLLDNHPDVYLAAVLVWGGVLKRDSDHAAMFLPVLAEGLPAVKRQLAQSKQGRLTADAALVDIGRWRY